MSKELESKLDAETKRRMKVEYYTASASGYAQGALLRYETMSPKNIPVEDIIYDLKEIIKLLNYIPS